MLVQRMIRAAKLDRDLFYEVERDETATGQAFLVVLIVALSPVVISALLQLNLLGLIIGTMWGAIYAVGNWLCWSAVAQVVAARLGGRSPFDGLMRPVAFSYAPGVLRVFTLIPGLAWPLSLVTGIWSLIALVIVIQESMHFTVGKAVLTVVLTTAILWVIGLIICQLTGMSFSAVGLLFPMPPR